MYEERSCVTVSVTGLLASFVVARRFEFLPRSYVLELCNQILYGKVHTQNSAQESDQQDPLF
jgi:replication initiation and membrane attachment protein DnaB